MPERAARASAEGRATATTRRPPRPVLVKTEGDEARAERAAAGRERVATQVERRASTRERVAPRAAPRERSSAWEANGTGLPGRRTVVIRGQVADRHSPRRRPERGGAVATGYYRPRPERAAKWAVLLGFLLVIVALASAHL
jgi:hypothetical protein